MVFWTVAMCSIAGEYQSFGGIYCLHLPYINGPGCKSCQWCRRGWLKWVVEDRSSQGMEWGRGDVALNCVIRIIGPEKGGQKK
jgi:hypothetical protein